jgi:hypothetical protein
VGPARMRAKQKVCVCVCVCVCACVTNSLKRAHHREALAKERKERTDGAGRASKTGESNGTDGATRACRAGKAPCKAGKALRVSTQLCARGKGG